MIADVSWFRYKGLQPELYNCPVVSKGCSLAAYYPKANSLQVLTTDVAVFKPNMD